MITGIRIDKVEARRDKDGEVTGLNINISVEKATVSGSEVVVDFNYSASYSDGIGELKMSGKVTAKEDKKTLDEITKRWESAKRLPDAFAETVLNAINYACGTNGVLVVRAVNLSPPIVPPRIQVGDAGSGETGA